MKSWLAEMSAIQYSLENVAPMIKTPIRLFNLIGEDLPNPRYMYLCASISQDGNQSIIAPSAKQCKFFLFFYQYTEWLLRKHI